MLYQEVQLILVSTIKKLVLSDIATFLPKNGVKSVLDNKQSNTTIKSW